MRYITSAILVAFLMGGFAPLAAAQTSGQDAAKDRATLNNDNNAVRHEENTLKSDVKSHHGNVKADEKAISHEQAIERRDSHNEAVERRNERNAARYKEEHSKK
jgi:uncharacterized protein YlxW (UPF0749 family)